MFNLVISEIKSYRSSNPENKFGDHEVTANATLFTPFSIEIGMEEAEPRYHMFPYSAASIALWVPAEKWRSETMLRDEYYYSEIEGLSFVAGNPKVHCDAIKHSNLVYLDLCWGWILGK